MTTYVIFETPNERAGYGLLNKIGYDWYSKETCTCGAEVFLDRKAESVYCPGCGSKIEIRHTRAGEPF